LVSLMYGIQGNLIKMVRKLSIQKKAKSN
jgi:hypothetical protein